MPWEHAIHRTSQVLWTSQGPAKTPSCLEQNVCGGWRGEHVTSQFLQDFLLLLWIKRGVIAGFRSEQRRDLTDVLMCSSGFCVEKRLVGKAKIGCKKASYEMMEAWLGVEVVIVEVMRSQPLTFTFRSKMLVLQSLHPQSLIKKFCVVCAK